MKGKTHSTEEIIRILRQADGGEIAQAICRGHNISEQTFYRWTKKTPSLRKCWPNRCLKNESSRR